MKRFLTPQEKKVLSYQKDGRNTYAESRAASRKAIALRKAKANRSLPHAQNAAVTAPAALDAVDAALPRTGKSAWRKLPDAPLGDYVGRSLRRRASSGMNPSHPASALLRKARRQLPDRPKYFKGPLQNDVDAD